MKLKISEFYLDKLSRLINEKTGISFKKERYNDLERVCNKIAIAMNENTQEYVKHIISKSDNDREFYKLIDFLTVGETYFFRDTKLFDALRNDVFPQIIKSKECWNKELNIWSAGCSSGEEPYSIAILLSELLLDIKDWKINIIATDINSVFLSKAEKGIYTEWSFREAPAHIKSRYFIEQTENKYELKRSISKMVKFRQLNLMDIRNSAIKCMDIILCRNTLMYLDSTVSKMILDYMYSALNESGYFAVAPCEGFLLADTDLKPLIYTGCNLYKKESTTNPASTCAAPGEMESKIDQEVEMVSKPKAEHIFANSEPIAKSLVLSDNILNWEESHGSKTNNTDTDRRSLYENLQKLYEIEDYQRLIEFIENINRNSIDEGELKSCYLMIIDSYSNLGIFERAYEWCNHAIKGDKLVPDYYYFRAQIEQESGNLESATDSLKKALYLDPNFIMAHFTIGDLHYRNNKTQEAVKSLKNALSLLERMDHEALIQHSDGMAAAELSNLIKMNLEGIK